MSDRRPVTGAAVSRAQSQPSIGDHPEVPCGIGDWDDVVYGHHRFLAEVHTPSEAAVVMVPWRRHDRAPDKIDTWVISPRGRRVRNVLRRHVGAERGELVFEPVDGPGTYAIYYLPFTHVSSPYYPQAQYRIVTPTADPDWVHRLHRGPDPQIATVLGYEASSELDSFAGLGFAATAAERDALRQADPEAAFRLFAETRDHGIGRADYLPARWALSAPEQATMLAADRGEFLAFQVGVYALCDLDEVTVTAAGFPFAVRHLTGGGIGEDGEPVTKSIRVADGWVQSLWFGADIPVDASPGSYRGVVEVSAADQRRSVEITVRVSASLVIDHGVGEPSRLARLAWLDGTAGQDHQVVAPLTPVAVAGDRLNILGRSVELGDYGLPAQITSTFSPTVTDTDGPEIKLLSGPVELDLGRPLRTSTSARPTASFPDLVEWRTSATAGALSVDIEGGLEADGCLNYRFRITAGEDTTLPDLRLAIPIRQQIADYWMGLGLQGCVCPDRLDWTWDVAVAHQEGAWIGSVSAGLQFTLRDERYRRPLNTNYYRERPLREPRWAGSGAGGVRLRSDGSTRLIEAFTGPITVAAGETCILDARFLLTPFKPIEPSRHFRDRYVHTYADPDQVAELGATVVNLHHATPPNPYINDPMRAQQRLADYTSAAHARGQRVKIYDTVRELTRSVPELPALVALGDEVFAAGSGGGHAWLNEHLPPDYVPGWAATSVDDVAVVTAGESRWHNIYVQTIEYLAEKAAIDGLYLDDVSFDRTTMKRVRRVLAHHRPDPSIDLHSANQYRQADGFASSANLYLDLLPYLDRLWFGEYVDYEATDPAYWLVEVSGIPFGLMGEMLENGGNPWRGMVFGMTGRAPRVDNRPLWQAWDDLDLPTRAMTGWWAGEKALRTDDPAVLATVFAGQHDAVIAVASWNDRPTTFRFAVDDLTPLASAQQSSTLRLTAPAIERFQEPAEFAVDQPIDVAPGRGWLLHLHNS